MSEMKRFRGKKSEPSLQSGKEIDRFSAARTPDDDVQSALRGLIKSAGVQVINPVPLFQEEKSEPVKEPEVSPKAEPRVGRLLAESH